MDTIDALLAGIEAGAVPTEVFSQDAVLDATVPNWRYTILGATAVQAEFSRWYADPGIFEELHRTPLTDGELVEFTLAWEEAGVTHKCHQAHVIRLSDGRVAFDTAFCGGRWPAPLLAEMASASQTAD
jgi:hypothetical protein